MALEQIAKALVVQMLSLLNDINHTLELYCIIYMYVHYMKK